jgi:hypothetical protein
VVDSSAEKDAARGALSLLRRIDPLWLAAPLGLIGLLFFRDAFRPNPDAYYHVKCAALYLREGWIDSFPWLPYTSLRDFPNAYIAYHLVVAPLHLVFAPERVIAVAGSAFAAAVPLSAYAILRRWQVSLPGLWVALLCLGSPVISTYFGALKGGAFFFVLLPWFLHFLLRGSARGVFAIVFLAVYAYVGAFLLPAMAVLYFLAAGDLRDATRRRVVVASLAAFALGMAVHPGPLDYARHVVAELMSSYYRPDALVAGRQLGLEWGTFSAADWLGRCYAMVALWGLFLLAQLRRGGPEGRGGMAANDVAATFVCLALLGYSAFSGAKLLHLFSVASVVVLPILACRYRPLSSRIVAGVATLATANAIYVSWQTIEAQYALEPPSTFARIAEVLTENSAPGEMVLAPWAAFPGLFFYDERNRYVAGMNTLFLLEESPERFDAYNRLYGGHAEEPERLLPQHFDDARLILVRGGVYGSGRLARQLFGSPHFAEIALPVSGWRLFQLER